MRDENLTSSRLGAHNELIAAAWLMKQGYDVFRNVAPVGPIDLVGVKDGKAEYFDVKVAYRNIDDKIIHPKLTEKQDEMGVRCIGVFDDGSCEIVVPSDGASLCEECSGTLFQAKRWARKRFCSTRCGQAHRRKLARTAPAEDGLPLV